MANKLISVVGMAGSGKSEVSEYLKLKRNFGYVRFGQIVLDKVKELGRKPSEDLERKIREELRAKHGMEAMAKLNTPIINKLISKSDVIADSIYSWEEYTFLKDKFADELIIIAVFASPKTRYMRLENRAGRHGSDPDLRFRSFSQEESKARDYAEIEKLHKAGPIVMADFLVDNNSSISKLHQQIDKIIEDIWRPI